MRTLLLMLISFMIGAILGAQRGLNKLKDETINLATNLYNNGIQQVLSSDEIANSDLSQQAQSYFQDQKQNFTNQAKSYIKDLLKAEIEAMFSSNETQQE